VLLAFGAGLLWAGCFGRQGYLIAPWLALAPFLYLLDRGPGWRAASWLGFAHGLGTWLLGVWWIAPTLSTYGQIGGFLGVVGLLLLAAYLALYHALFALLAVRMRGGWLRTMSGWAGLWVALELLRGVVITGFPWNLAGYAFAGVPGALPTAAWIGAWGLSFLLVFANAGIALAAQRRRWELAAVGVGAPLIVLAMGARWAVPDGGDPVTARPVRIIQPNIENMVTFDGAEAAAGYGRLLRMSREACDEPGALLVWPESAAWPLAWDRDEQLRRDVAALTERGCSVVLNSVRSAGEKYFNSVYLIAPGEPARSADKRHLVPFGEYVPLKSVLPFVGKLARNAGDFSAAEEIALLPWGGERFGAAVCFEVVFPGEVAAAVRSSATLLVTVTNDAWYGPTSAPWQHFRAAQFRAAENRRPLLRAAITGVSGLVRADGSIAALLGPGEEGILRGRVGGRSDLSPFTRAPWVVPAFSVLVALAALIARRL
jgi:apolipoprotein N-acyltransferase